MQFGTAAEWQKWWSREGASFKPREVLAVMPERNADKQTVSYWNVPVRSDRVSFIVDVSGSMAKPFGTGSGTRLTEAKRQLTDVLGRLPKKAKINIITFADSAQSLFPKLQALGKKQHKAAAAHIKEIFAKGTTNVHDALEAAFADRDVDTIFLLTDGRPSDGPVVDPTALADEVARWNVSRSIVIHTIAIGAKSPFLARLAKDSGGEHSVAR
jgi:Mg-chelatase subunit ChlD